MKATSRCQQPRRHRDFEWRILHYEADKRSWVIRNPKASPGEYARAMTRIAKQCRV